ncbi:MAG: hypothetical protein A2Y25_01435 [Candidatus Melainabacteria bacterium GWF2_37_15]|nr:MAG: hypothetical protein A2Y25_01435 [Candidatus Melainabacteria bacterium GWF2_37_15]
MSEKNIDLDQIKNLIVHPKIGEILLQHKKISIYQLAEGLEGQKNTKSPIGRILIDRGFISENELVELLSLQNNIAKLLEDSYSELERLKGDSPDI